MGIVCMAKHQLMNRTVAIKMLPSIAFNRWKRSSITTAFALNRTALPTTETLSRSDRLFSQNNSAHQAGKRPRLTAFCREKDKLLT